MDLDVLNKFKKLIQEELKLNKIILTSSFITINSAENILLLIKKGINKKSELINMKKKIQIINSKIMGVIILN